jgi:two-component system response regulator DesR
MHLEGALHLFHQGKYMQQPDDGKVRAVIASRPGVMQESLRTMLTGSGQVAVTGSAGGGLSALSMVREVQPALLVVDSNLLEDEVVSLLREVKGAWPEVRCLVLVQTTGRKNRALAAGADAVVSRNDPAAAFNQALRQLA